MPAPVIVAAAQLARKVLLRRLLKLGLVARPDDQEPAALHPADSSEAGERARDAPLAEPVVPVVPGWDRFRNHLSDESPVPE